MIDVNSIFDILVYCAAHHSAVVRSLEEALSTQNEELDTTNQRAMSLAIRMSHVLWHGLAMQLVVADAEGKVDAYDKQVKTTQVITAGWHSLRPLSQLDVQKERQQQKVAALVAEKQWLEQKVHRKQWLKKTHESTASRVCVENASLTGRIEALDVANTAAEHPLWLVAKEQLESPTASPGVASSTVIQTYDQRIAGRE